MHAIIYFSLLMILHATRIHASTLLAELIHVRIEHGNKLVDFTQLYPKFSPDFPSIYKYNEQIYELWARPLNQQLPSLVTKFSLSDIPCMTPDNIVLKGTWIAKSIILHCELLMENAQKIYLDYRPAVEQQRPLYRSPKLWKIFGLCPSDQTRLDVLQVTRKSLGIFGFPENMLRQYVIRSVENDGKPYLAFGTHNFGVVAYRGTRVTKAILVIEQMGGSDELNHYYGLEFEDAQDDAFVQVMSNDRRHRPDLITDVARMYLSAWLSDSD